MSFSDRVRQLRKEKGLTQVELAKGINVSDSTIKRYETSVAEPTMTAIMTLADYFDVSTDYLLGYSNARELTLAERLNLSDKAVKNLITKVIHGLSDVASDSTVYSKCVDMFIASGEFIKFICLLAFYVDIDKDINDSVHTYGVEQLFLNTEHLSTEDKIALAKLRLYEQGQALIEDVNKQWHSQSTIDTINESTP